MVDILAFLFIALHLMLPVLGIIWLGIRNERRKQQAILNDSLKSLRLVNISRFRRY